MDSEIGFSVIFFLVVVGIIGTSTLLLHNWQEREYCRLMKDSGFAIEIRWYMLFAQQCYVKDDTIGKYIPYEKFRAFAD